MLELLENIDLGLFNFLNKTIANEYFDFFFLSITDLHKNLVFKLLVYPLILGLLFFKFKRKGILIFIFCAFTVGTTDLVGNWGFKKIFERSRPGDNPKIHAIVRSPYAGYSFISNHAANMFSFAVVVSFFMPVFRYYLFFLASLVAFSRVYNGVHYPSDILFGGILGFFIAKGAIFIWQNWLLKGKREKK